MKLKEKWEQAKNKAVNNEKNEAERSKLEGMTPAQFNGYHFQMIKCQKH